ncbi:CheR family methyltransferase [Megalodesulfovibrio gigas]|uniref:Putative PAS:CheB methylesterase:MCP methyltransferase, CheR-type n=1 Tax=Megalodesulfovibrio gigas (strain ATCC 19364 / DSM 1382 / NCIMB 9332 / VKM B-1759) TaxID=1121448 RepID=T2GEL0_MEGG1|nr:CheR family methyltransferase [Megalodesulfovibrio gigas]AGW15045.1 putative PAS:CheB methylesterase:MCP methyltransferase, CheR-type [Megalodesulfovibrio gigas DSM 1382 = ATCC 19364]
MTATESKAAITPPALLVGLGASAGGLDALSVFLDALATLEDARRWAFFIVQHQSPEAGKDVFTSLLSKHTSLAVVLAEDGMHIAAGVVHVAPPDKRMALFDGRIQLEPREVGGGMAIDHFLLSLAQEANGRVAAVILSGSNTDGVKGCRAVSETGGLVLAQTPASAAFDTMPRSIIDANLADDILPPAELPVRIAAFAKKLDMAPGSVTVREAVLPSSDRDKVLMLIKSKSKQDFSLYKDNTVNRRIMRRMHVHHIETLKEYVAFLRGNAEESRALFKDMLISVTNFFRDAEAFETLKELLRERLPTLGREQFRAWTPGCATGEEAYSVAIIVRELLDELGLGLQVVIYATDLDDAAISKARAGVFPESIAADLGEARTQRFFVSQEGRLKAKSEIRDMLVFAVQNVIQDPPFSSLDLICCRNLLMYLKAQAQEKVLAQFQYSLRPRGLFMLGSSESVSSLAEPFQELHKKHRIFERKSHGAQAAHAIAGDVNGHWDAARAEALVNMPMATSTQGHGTNTRQIAERLLLAASCPPSLLVSKTGEVLYIHGRTGRYLELREGLLTTNVLDMARQGLRFDLATAINAASVKNQPQVRHAVKVIGHEQEEFVDILVSPVQVPEWGETCCVITFTAIPAPRSISTAEMDTVHEDIFRLRITDLEGSLQQLREDMQSVVEEYEAANEELKSANEELQSTNEELKSTNEELETAKEELQSINEEQSTLNAELQGKNEELAHIGDDMANLLTSTRIATLFLDRELRIKRFTPAMRRIMALRPGDLDRPVQEIALHLEYKDLESDVHNVLTDLNTLTRELKGTQGDWYQLRINPYRTLGDVIVGVVATFNDITQLKHSEMEAEAARALAESIIQTVREPLLVLDAQLVVQSANKAFYIAFKTTPADVVGVALPQLGQGQWNVPALLSLAHEALSKGTEVRDQPLPHVFPSIGPLTLRISVRPILVAGRPSLLLLAVSGENMQS